MRLALERCQAGVSAGRHEELENGQAVVDRSIVQRGEPAAVRSRVEAFAEKRRASTHAFRAHLQGRVGVCRIYIRTSFEQQSDYSHITCRAVTHRGK